MEEQTQPQSVAVAGDRAPQTSGHAQQVARGPEAGTGHVRTAGGSEGGRFHPYVLGTEAATTPRPVEESPVGGRCPQDECFRL